MMLLRQSATLVAAIFTAALAPSPARADLFNFRGQFHHDDSIVLYQLTVGALSNVTITTSSYASGGFDPTLAVFDSSGVEIAANDDGGASVNPSPVSGARLDSYVALTLLPAGAYYLALTESPNFANGPTLLGGFSFTDFSQYSQLDQVWAAAGSVSAGSSDFTCATFLGQSGPFCDSILERLDGHYALEIEGATSVDEVPEPASVLLLASIILSSALHQRRRAFASSAGHRRLS